MENKFQQSRKSFEHFMYSWKTIFFLGFLMVLALNSTWNVYKKKNESEVIIRDTNMEALALEKKELILRTNIEKLKTVSGVEDEIRSTYGLAKEGEGVVVVYDDPVATNTPELVPKRTFWQKFKDLFR